MRKRVQAALLAVTVSAAAAAPTSAQADASPTTIYVDNLSSNCTDTGTGTAAAPYCSLQTALNATVPGDTVYLWDTSYYGPVTMTKSGTASQPITIEPAPGGYAYIQSGQANTGATLAVQGASYVTFENLGISQATGLGITVSGSSHITLDRLVAGSKAGLSTPGLEISGDSSDVTVSRGMFVGRKRVQAAAIQIDPGSSGDVITTNGVEVGAAPAISVNGAPGTDVTSNTVISDGCGTGISLTGAATGSSIENNVIEALTGSGASPCPASSTPSALLSVASTAAAGTSADYNLVYPSQSAPTLPGTVNGPDEYAYSWANRYYPTVSAFLADSGQGKHDILADPQIQPALGFNLDSTATQSPLINSANSDAPGELPTDLNGQPWVNDPLVPDTGSGTYSYYPRGAVRAEPDASPGITTQVENGADVTATAQQWSTSGYTFNFGDGTSNVPGSYGVAQHAYQAPGTYTITVTGTSESGQPFSDTTSVIAMPANTLVIRDTTWSSWYVSATGIARSAITSMPNGSDQLVAVTTGGQLEHNIHLSNGTWQGWRALTQPGVNVVDASIAGMPDGSAQLVELLSNGTILHNIRRANGSWQGWANPGGSGIAQISITAMPDGSAQLVAVTTTGRIEHNIRRANGSWQGWAAPAQPSTSVKSASIAGMSDGSARILAVGTNGTLEYTIRNANGSWQKGWIAASGVDATQASIAVDPGGTDYSYFTAALADGNYERGILGPDGSWDLTDENTSQLYAVKDTGSVCCMPAGQGLPQYIAVTSG